MPACIVYNTQDCFMKLVLVTCVYMYLYMYTFLYIASLVAQMVKNPPAKWETQVRSLGWKDPPKEDMTTHSSILAQRVPMDRGAQQVTVHGVTQSQSQLRD